MKPPPLDAEPILSFDSNNFRRICDHLANADAGLKTVIDAHGYPPMWTRENNFETLVHIILEQQVSLASALATLNKLKEQLGKISPKTILALSDDDMRACFVSRQKMGYLRGLAQALESRHIQLKKFERMTNEEVREALLPLKGIGHWTIDVYLMFVLRRVDIFPIGDLAAVNAFKRLRQLPASTTKERILEHIAGWKPYRSVACMILWHFYLSSPKR